MGSWWACIRNFDDYDPAVHIQGVLDPSRFLWPGYEGLVHFVALTVLGTDEAREVVTWACRGRGNRGNLNHARAARVLLDATSHLAFDDELEQSIELVSSDHSRGRLTR